MYCVLTGVCCILTGVCGAIPVIFSCNNFNPSFILQLRKVMWQTRLSEHEPELTVEEEDTASEPEPVDPDGK